MYISLALAAALWPATVTEQCPPHKNALVIGVAVNSGGEFLYCEYFSATDQYNFKVTYVRNTTIFAIKELDYSIDPFIPLVKQIDQRTGELRETQIEGEKLRLVYRESNNKKLQITTIAKADVHVVDAGFDHFVKSNWNDLTSGKSLTINFASMAHQKSLPLRIAKGKCTQLQNSASSQHCFSVDIDNSFLRLLLSNIIISYDANKRLIQFDGVVNLQDDASKAQRASIHYFYKEDYLSQVKMQQ